MQTTKQSQYHEQPIKKSQFDGSETVILHLNNFSKIEQAELLAHFFINSNCNQHEAAITMCYISDLLSDVLSG